MAFCTFKSTIKLQVSAVKVIFTHIVPYSSYVFGQGPEQTDAASTQSKPLIRINRKSDELVQNFRINLVVNEGVPTLKGNATLKGIVL